MKVENTPTTGKLQIQDFEIEIQEGKKLSFKNIKIEYTCSESVSMELINIIKPLIKLYTKALSENL